VFRAVLCEFWLQSLQKEQTMFLQKLNIGIKKQKIHADLGSTKLQKLLSREFFATFSTDSKSASDYAFSNPD
jgi:hypothetical protein